jgi:hypothetical protein
MFVLVLIGVPVLELFVFIEVGRAIGWLPAAGPLSSRAEVLMLLLDAEPSRKERGHRGVRPRHLN